MTEMLQPCLGWLSQARPSLFQPFSFSPASIWGSLFPETHSAPTHTKAVPAGPRHVSAGGFNLQIGTSQWKSI